MNDLADVKCFPFVSFSLLLERDSNNGAGEKKGQRKILQW